MGVDVLNRWNKVSRGASKLYSLFTILMNGTEYRKASFLYTFFFPDSAYKFNEEQRKVARQKDDLKLHKVYGLVFEIERHDFQKAARTVVHDRSKAKVASVEGFLPLHLAVYNRAMYELLDVLIDAMPSALKTRDPKGMLPIHIASRDNTVLITIIQLLIRWWPESLEEKDPDGDIPVQMSIRWHLPKEVTNYYLEVNPDTLDCQDIEGNTLLHLSLRYDSHIDLFYGLLRACPEAVRIKNHRGDLPLHRACLFSADLDMIKSLVELYPESLKMTDDQKNLPVHLYYMRLKGGRISESALHFFMEGFPASVGIRNSYGCTPFEILDNHHEQLESYQY